MDIKKTQENISGFMNRTIGSVISIFKVLVRSKFNLKLPLATSDSCVILGNGPSLRESMEKNMEMLKQSTLFCVNNFATTKEFFELQPENYVLLDPGFFIRKDREDVAATLSVLKNKVTWKINFFVPYIYRHDEDVQFLINQHGNINIVFYNYVVYSGSKKLGFFMFRKNLAMPQLYNVLGASILLAVNMKYKTVKIVGADHSWHDEIVINNENEMCWRDKHFYDGNEQLPLKPIIDPVSLKKQKMGDFYRAMYNIFNTYYLLNEYANRAGCTILNVSEFSYIDAFKRKKT